jgi:hypothetical protein
MKSLHENLAECHLSISRGKVWCRTCGSEIQFFTARRPDERHTFRLAEALRKALEFYADVSKYPAPLTGDLWADCGQIAHAALIERGADFVCHVTARNGTTCPTGTAT